MGMFSNIKLVILDRDGVINEDSEHYIKSPEEFHPIPGSLEAIAALNKAGLIVAVATNQSGIGRGYYSPETLQAIHEKMYRLLADEGGHIDMLVYCPHVPEDHCNCRKPKPGLIKQILVAYPEIQLSQVLVVGDSMRDLEAGWNAQCNAVLVRTGNGLTMLAKHGDELKDVEVFDDLKAVVSKILSF
jgi:D-glycero-D-manno-heptose 1,7-bisphosphate phosphatase